MRIKTKHTAGPWEYHCDNNCDYWDIDAKGNRVASLARYPEDNSSPAEQEFNARLIAAAPEMLDMLDWVCQDVCGDASCDCIIRQLINRVTSPLSEEK